MGIGCLREIGFGGKGGKGGGDISVFLGKGRVDEEGGRGREEWEERGLELR